MMKLSLSVVALAALIAAIFAPSLVARGRRVTQFRVRPRHPLRCVAERGQHWYRRLGYRAYLAATDDWTCRDFKPLESSDAALRTALSALGNEGSKLVSVVSEAREPIAIRFDFPIQPCTAVDARPNCVSFALAPP
jgi:hypothetical protein